MELPDLTPPHQASHGHTVDRHGTPAPSHTALTGMVVSGAELVTTRSTPLAWISCVVTCAATVGLDWLSLTMIWNLYLVPPIFIPFVKRLEPRIRLRTNLSGPANVASAPVEGVT